MNFPIWMNPTTLLWVGLILCLATAWSRRRSIRMIGMNLALAICLLATANWYAWAMNPLNHLPKNAEEAATRVETFLDNKVAPLLEKWERKISGKPEPPPEPKPFQVPFWIPPFSGMTILPLIAALSSLALQILNFRREIHLHGGTTKYLWEPDNSSQPSNNIERHGS